jgi:hypothetical protein
VEAVKASKETY